MKLEWGVVFATRRNPNGHILIAHIPGYVLDERLACYHVDNSNAAYWWIIDRQTGMGIGAAETLEIVKRLLDKGYLHDLLRLTIDKVKKLRPKVIEKCAARMIVHLRNLEVGNKAHTDVYAVEYPQNTMLQDFLEKYPNAPLNINGDYPECCPFMLGYKKGDCIKPRGTCVECWNRPVE